MNCKTCGHSKHSHKKSSGICLQCNCNLYRKPNEADDFAERDTDPSLSQVFREGDRTLMEAADRDAALLIGSDDPFSSHQAARAGFTEVIQRGDGVAVYVDGELTSLTPKHVPPMFVEVMDEVMEEGVKNGRKAGDWKDLPPEMLEKKLRSAIGHMARGEYVAAACNCLILWWHLQREGDNHGDQEEAHHTPHEDQG